MSNTFDWDSILHKPHDLTEAIAYFRRLAEACRVCPLLRAKDTAARVKTVINDTLLCDQSDS